MPQFTGCKETKRVENSSGITASLQGRYASALFELANEQGSLVAVEQDLNTLGDAISSNADLAELIRNPKVAREDAAKAMDAVAGVLGLNLTTRNFLGVLAGNRRLAILPAVTSAFAAIAAAHRGEVTANVTSAHPLNEEQLAQLAAKLKEREGKDVKIKTTIDPEILGGLVVRIGSRQIDGSIRTRLNTLAQAMKG